MRWEKAQAVPLALEAERSLPGGMDGKSGPTDVGHAGLYTVSAAGRVDLRRSRGMSEQPEARDDVPALPAQEPSR
jgi:hypothetical protein